MVLHVPRPLHGPRVDVSLELLEQLAVTLADDVDQDVQPTAVGHADGHLGQARSGRLVDDRINERDGRLPALETEPLLPDVRHLVLRNCSRRLGRVQPIDDQRIRSSGVGWVETPSTCS